MPYPLKVVMQSLEEGEMIAFRVAHTAIDNFVSPPSSSIARKGHKNGLCPLYDKRR
jgi:hypothetical protein